MTESTAIQQTLTGGNLISEAIALLCENEPEEGYYLAFSGGKDSICCYHLLKQAGCKFSAHYAHTTIDPPELLRFIRTEYPDVEITRPTYHGKPTNYYALIAQKGLPTRHRRWCCDALKHTHGKGRVVVTGVRAEESARRAATYSPVWHVGKSKQILPIFNWNTSDVWVYIRSLSLLSGSLRPGIRQDRMHPLPFDVPEKTHRRLSPTQEPRQSNRTSNRTIPRNTPGHKFKKMGEHTA